MDLLSVLKFYEQMSHYKFSNYNAVINSQKTTWLSREIFNYHEENDFDNAGLLSFFRDLHSEVGYVITRKTELSN